MGLDRQGRLAGLSTAYLSHSDRLRTDVWQFRTFVAPDHRRGHLMSHLAFATRGALLDGYVSGADTRAPGILLEIENLAIERRFPWPVFPISFFTFIGTTPAGAYLRVLWFPGARLAPGD